MRLWRASSGEVAGEPIRSHNGWIAGVVVCEDGTRIESCSGSVMCVCRIP